jgi:hypothetical protein
METNAGSVWRLWGNSRDSSSVPKWNKELYHTSGIVRSTARVVLPFLQTSEKEERSILEGETHE